MPFPPDFGSVAALASDLDASAPPANFDYRFRRRDPPKYGKEALHSLAASMTAAPGRDSATPAGYTYLGQFLLHDISFDVTPLPDGKASGQLPTVRTPRFDLDSVYGRGVVEEPYLYDRYQPYKMQLGSTSGPKPNDYDLPRTLEGFAIIPEPRNDENLITGQLHVAWLHFHNRMVDLLTKTTQTAPKDLFEAARQEVIDHYQRMIRYDYLPKSVDESVILSGNYANTVRRNDKLFIPIEFSHGAFRFGHAMIRDTYDYNRIFEEATFSQLMLFSGSHRSSNPFPLPENWVIDWRRFFPFPESGVTGSQARKISPAFAPSLAALDVPSPGMRNLAEIDLTRAYEYGVCSGEEAAAALKKTVLTGEQVGLPEEFAGSTPLLYYVLREAELLGNGERLGPVGGQIVCDTILGLLEADPLSVVNDTKWTPKIPVTLQAWWPWPTSLRSRMSSTRWARSESGQRTAFAGA